MTGSYGAPCLAEIFRIGILPSFVVFTTATASTQGCVTATRQRGVCSKKAQNYGHLSTSYDVVDAKALVYII